MRAITTNNGTTVFRPALVALGIGPGDEVILALHIATPNADRYCGATPVLVDCGEETLTIDVRAIESRSPPGRAIIPVHIHRYLVDRIFGQRRSIMSILPADDVQLDTKRLYRIVS
jgi:perosamine synthetase